MDISPTGILAYNLLNSRNGKKWVLAVLYSTGQVRKKCGTGRHFVNSVDEQTRTMYEYYGYVFHGRRLDLGKVWFDLVLVRSAVKDQDQQPNPK